MAGLCTDSVLTGQEGSISFKPPGTSVCVRDFSPFGQDGSDTHITLPCDSDFRVGDVVVFREEDGGKLDSALSATVGGFAVSGEILSLGDFVSGSGFTDGTYTGVALTGGSGTGATADISIASGEISIVSLVDGGSGYRSTDQLGVAPSSVGGTGTGFIIEVETVSTLTGSQTAYYVVGKGVDNAGEPWIEVGMTKTGAAIVLAQDGGTGTADTELPAHINIELADFYGVCGVREFSFELSRDELDVTTLPCIDTTAGAVGCDRLAAFKSTQAGYAEASGSLTVYFTGDQESISGRLLGSALLRSQTGATVKLYVSTVTSGGAIDDAASMYVEADINITGMSFSVNPDDPTSAELSFSVRRMVSAFGLTN